MRIWQRCHTHEWNAWRTNFVGSGWTPANGCPITGFVICESFPNVDIPRLTLAIQTCRGLGFAAKPGIVWHIGSEEPDRYNRYLQWLNRMAWFRRAGVAASMLPLQDPLYKGIYIDLELYDSAGQEHCPWERYEYGWYATQPLVNTLGGEQVTATQFLPGAAQNTVFGQRIRNTTWIEENYWNLSEKSGVPLADEISQMQRTAQMMRDQGRGWMPECTQSISRDYAEPVRQALAAGGIDDVFAWNDGTQKDVSLMGTADWRTRPQEPPDPPDPAAMGLMALDCDFANVPVGPCTSFVAVPGSVSPTFLATNAAHVIDEYAPIRRKFLRFNESIPRQGFRANLGRQLSADYTLAFVGIPPSWRYGNDGTGWQLGPQRFTALQKPVSPTARWQWGECVLPADENTRHVIVCEQQAIGQMFVLIDGVPVAAVVTSAIQPDGTMSLGNNDSMTSRPAKMDMERITVFEGVTRAKSLALSRAYCEWYGIRWRGVE